MELEELMELARDDFIIISSSQLQSQMVPHD
jgi:hypothetical protein